MLDFFDAFALDLFIKTPRDRSLSTGPLALCDAGELGPENSRFTAETRRSQRELRDWKHFPNISLLATER